MPLDLGDIDRRLRIRARLGPVGRRLAALRLPLVWAWLAPKLRRGITGDAERWLPLRLSLHSLVMVGLAGLAAIVLWDFFAAWFPTPLPPDLKVEVIRLVMYVIAGLGGVVALVIAYRRQRLGEIRAILDQSAEAREQTRAFNEQFAAAVDQLSSDKAANRLAGVYAMAGLADGWATGRQTCINVLCAYMRMPYDPPEEAPDLGTADACRRYQERRVEHQVRRTVMDVIGERLRAEPVPGKTWHGHDFDFSGAVLDSGNLGGVRVSGGLVGFSGAVFSGGLVDFSGAVFSGGRVDFSRAVFSGGIVGFIGAVFSGARVDFSRAVCSDGQIGFSGAVFSGGLVDFSGAVFSGGRVDLSRAVFSGGIVGFGRAVFSGGRVDLLRAEFSGGCVDFRNPREWSQPPVLDGYPEGGPPGLLLPDVETGRSSDASGEQVHAADRTPTGPGGPVVAPRRDGDDPPVPPVQR